MKIRVHSWAILFSHHERVYDILQKLPETGVGSGGFVGTIARRVTVDGNESMSILTHGLMAGFLAQTTSPAPADSFGVMVLGIAGVVVLAIVAIAFWKGAFTRRALEGPVRLPANVPPGNLWVSIVATIVVWIAVPTIALSAKGGVSQKPAPPPVTTQGAPDTTKPDAIAAFTPLEQIVLGMTAATCALVTCLVVTRLQMPGVLSGGLGLHPRFLPAGLLIGIIGSFVAVPLTIWSSSVATYLWTLSGETVRPHELLNLLNSDRARLIHVLGMVSAVLITPIFEETLFRGLVQTAFAAQTGNRWVGVIMASSLFAIVHPVGWMTVPLFLLAICFGTVYERTGNLWAAITMHAVFNGVSLLMQS